jgi:hypothetical protein
MQRAISAAIDWLGSKFGKGSSGSGVSDVAKAAAAGMAQAAPLMAASTMLDASGGMLVTAGSMILSGAIALQMAADTLMAANMMKAATLGLASGGYVVGAGTETSDSIPARLSNGEFVVRAAAVRAVGVATLVAINRGLRIPAIAGGIVPRFAGGGLVQADTSGGRAGEIRMQIGLERGLVLQELESSAAGKIVVKHAYTNAKAMQKAISRG